MKTTVYIDGFNFYYALLKGTPYKWIDYHVLFARYILPTVSQANPISSLKIKVFTAPTKANFHPNGEKSAQAQLAFWRALEQQNPNGILEIIKGNHLPSRSSAYPFCESSPKKPHTFEKVGVWKLEEKLTDVQLSLAIYRDVVKGDCDQVVLCSNDSDISPVLNILKEDHPEVCIGVVFPIKAASSQGRRFSIELNKHSTWRVKSISDADLQSSQMPDRVKTAKKPIIKPDFW